MHQFWQGLIGAVTAATILAVPALAVGVLPSSGAIETVSIAPGDDPLVNELSTFQQAPARPAAQPRSARGSEAPAEIMAQEWVATGGGGGPHGSPKG
jgi:hypothetical protein